MTNWLITGANGQLGHELTTTISDPVTALDHNELDITNPVAVQNAVEGHQIVVNAAAWTDVDGAEKDEQAATRVNGAGVVNLARACQRTGAHLIHISTGAVFPGDRPHREADQPAPFNAYGRSKLAGELAVRELLGPRGTVIRTSWLYAASSRRRNFVATMLQAANDGRSVRVVADQWGQPTWTRDLARTIDTLGLGGIYHLTGAGAASWYTWARAIFELAGHDPARIIPISRVDYKRIAPTAQFDLLERTRGPSLPHWRESLERAISVWDLL